MNPEWQVAQCRRAAVVTARVVRPAGGDGAFAGAGTFHHHAWQTQSIADLGKLGDRLHRAGRDLIWGPVRHGAGHNIAAYFVETSGAVVELYTDLEQVYDDDREPVVWGAEANWWNMRSPFRPEGFREHGLRPVVDGP